MLPRREVIHRANSSNFSPSLPDDVIEQIIDNFSPAQLSAYGWCRVNRGFRSLIRRRIFKVTSFDASQEDIVEFFRPVVHSGNFDNFPQHAKLLQLLLRDVLSHVHEMRVPFWFLSLVHCVWEKNGKPAGLCSLNRLTLQVGAKSGRLDLSKHLSQLNSSSGFFGDRKLKEVHVDITVDDEELVTCCGLRELLRNIKEASDEKTSWNFTIRDTTVMGQGWFGPLDLTKHRNKSFICFVRVLLELSISIDKLIIIDEMKPSPYMMIMTGTKHRALYMYPEFKMCRQLVLCYDIGLVAPVFAHENDRFLQLNRVEVDESHLLYKTDFIEYLRNATNLEKLCIVVPSTWTRRVSNCKLGCFFNPSYECFRADGWCSVRTKLPNTKFELI